MKAEKIIKTTEPIDIQIDGITLLSVEEAGKVPNSQRAIGKVWWLRSPGDFDISTASVLGDGSVSDYGYHVNLNVLGVRPALIFDLESSNLQINDQIVLAGYTWTVIDGGYALCNEIVRNTCFRENWGAKDANQYEASDIKKWLENWAREKGIL